MDLAAKASGAVRNPARPDAVARVMAIVVAIEVIV
jgi:hypothetical protein